MGEEPAGVGPRDGGGAVEPEFVAASRMAMRSIEPLPPRLPLPTVLPTLCFRCPGTALTAPVDAGLERVGCPAARRPRGGSDQALGKEESGDEVGPLRTSAACAGPNLRTLLIR